jgi:hypothetical protein
MDSGTTYAGVDWASRAHAVCVVDGHGTALERFEVEHSEPGLRALGRRLTRTGVSGVAIERPDGPVIEALVAAGLTVFVIASRNVKALRTRYGTAGNKDDRADAYLLADVLRTDGQRLRPLQPDSPETVTLRATVRARKDLVQTRVRLMQQLRAHLELVYPGAVGLFWELDSPIALRFLLRFPSAARAAWLSPKRMAAWLRGEGVLRPDEPRRAVPAARGSTPRGHRPGSRGASRGHARLRPGAAGRPGPGGRARGADRGAARAPS